MDGSRDAYVHLLEVVREKFPEIADQIEDEVIRGKTVPADALSASQRREYPSRSGDIEPTMGPFASTSTEYVQNRAEARTTKLAKWDLVALDYTGDEMLGLLVDAVLRLGYSMAKSRRMLDDLKGRDIGGLVRFIAWDGTDEGRVELNTDSVSDVVRDIQDNLRSALETLGSRQPALPPL
jgi:hypothetical protein